MNESRENEISLIGSDPRKEHVMDLWFQDSIEFGHGCSLHIKIKNFVYHSRSKYQQIAIMDTEKMGKMLAIDGVTMLTEYDEFAYHEMITHVPLLVHPKPSKVLIIGGGDGGTVREVIKHPEVEMVHVCEIDEEVVTACRKYLPSLASSFDDPRVQIFFEDGARFVAKQSESYDIIIVDSTDPIGPGKILFQEGFYKNLKKTLSKEGIAVTQCESIFLHKHVIQGVYSFAKDIFPQLNYYFTLVPTYPSGTIGFFFCSLKWGPLQNINKERAKRLKNLRYYTPDIHRASFALPCFAMDFFHRK